MTDDQWQEAEDVAAMLRKPFEVTKKLQLEGLTPGYFFRKWDGLKKFLDDNGSLFACEVHESMVAREEDLFNPVLLAGVLVDVQHAEKLDESQVRVATSAVVDLALRMAGLSSAKPSEATEVDADSSFEYESDDDFRQLDRNERNRQVESSRPPVVSDDDELPELDGSADPSPSPSSEPPSSQMLRRRNSSAGSRPKSPEEMLKDTVIAALEDLRINRDEYAR